MNVNLGLSLGPVNPTTCYRWPDEIWQVMVVSGQRNDHGHLRKSNKCKMASYSKMRHNSVTTHLKSVNRANQKNSFHFINLYKQAKQNSEKTYKPVPPHPNSSNPPKNSGLEQDSTKIWRASPEVFSFCQYNYNNHIFIYNVHWFCI